MKIGIISDTHNNLQGIEKAIQVFTKNKVELILHAGDWVAVDTAIFFDQQILPTGMKVKGVLGNNDLDLENMLQEKNLKLHNIDISLEPYIELVVDNKNIAMTHSHRWGVLNNLIESEKYDLVIHGHTHKVKNITVGQTHVLNPGAASFSIPRTRNYFCTVAIYETKQNKAEIITLD